MLAGWRRRARKPAGIRFLGTRSSKERPCRYEVSRRVSHLGPSPQTRPGRPCRPCQPWGLGLSRNTVLPPAAVGTGHAGQLFTSRWTPAAQPRPLCGPPGIPPTSSHPTSSQGTGSQAVSAWPATWMCTHCLAPRGLGTLRPLGVRATGPSPEAGPSPGGRPGGVGAAVPVASAPPCPGAGPEAWRRPGRGEAMDTAKAPCPQGY